MRRLTTEYVAMNPRQCMACWQCVDKCPKNVIGKNGFLWHKHVVFQNADACIGCGKCIKTCPNDVFFKAENSPTSLNPRQKPHKKTLSKINRLLLVSFLASAFSGVALHMAGHFTTHEYWHFWSAVHVLASILFIIFAIRHIWMHHLWHSKFHSLLFLGLLITGVILLAFIDGDNSPLGMWHYRLGLIFIVATLAHVSRRIR